MVHHRRSMAWAAMLFGIFMLAACGPDETRQVPGTQAVPQSSHDAMINERLSAVQSRIAELDHKISEAAVVSRQLNEELTALRRDLAGSAVQRPAAAPTTVPVTPAVPGIVQPQGQPQPAPTISGVMPREGTTQGPQLTAAPAPTPTPTPAPPSHNPMFWFLVLAILVVAIVIIIKVLMGPWSDEEDSDWIEEDAISEEDEETGPESGEAAEPGEKRDEGDEIKP